jgi:DNA-binding NarL/FixJ family response regulator
VAPVREGVSGVPIGILLGGGNPPGLHDLRAFLEGEGFEILGEASDGCEVVALAVSLRPALVILDSSMPRVSAVEAAREILKLCSETRVVLVSPDAAGDEVIAAFRAGIRGCIVEADSTATLVRAIREVSGGRLFLSPYASRGITEAYLPQAVPPAPVLP